MIRHAPRVTPGSPGRRPAWHTLALTLAAVLVLAACGSDDGEAEAPAAANGTGMNAAAESGEDGPPRFPAVFGYYDDQEVFFIHSETSNPDVSNMLTEMMGGSPVLVVDNLAEISTDLLGTVYVFTNGIQPEDTPRGPLNYQPDVFDSAPGDPDYTPLRTIMLVTWAEDAEPRLLTSEQEILEAQEAGEVTLEERGAVAVMPLLTWPGGQR